MLLKKSLLSILSSSMLLSLVSCNEAEFYEKEFEDIGTTRDQIVIGPDPIIVPDPVPDPDPDPTPDPTPDPIPDPTPDPDPIPDPIYYDNIDTFTQNSAEDAKIDILWVIDDSGSMGDNQEELGRNFDAFINEFIQRDVDFRMAITTTDADYLSGQMRGDWTRMTSQAAQDDENDFLDYFNETVQVGVNGSITEQGLYTAMSFTQRHSSFMRDDAIFIVVILSDEEEQSGVSVLDYYNYFTSLKSNPGMVKVNSIVAFEDNNSWLGDETRGERYIQLSNMTNGISADIESDFYTTLTDMGGKIVDLIDSFILSEKPVENSIIVRVNGIIVNDYTYDEQNRTISFNAGSVPAEGSEVEITYKSLEQSN